MNQISLFDGHCDTLHRCCDPTDSQEIRALRQNAGHVDLLRCQEAFSSHVQFFAIFGSKEEGRGQTCLEQYEQQYRFFQKELEKNADLMGQCRTMDEARTLLAEGKIAAFLSVEGADLLDCDLGQLEEAWRRGVRMVNLTWNFENILSGSNDQGADKGLTHAGRRFVRKMQELGILVDVSHLSDPGFWDVAALSQQAGLPFVASHSNSRRLCPHKRNLTDEQFLALVHAGGVAGLNFCDLFLGEFPTLETATAHIEHFWSLGGEANVAIGGDWDGCSLAYGVRGITDVRELYELLLRKNHKETLVQDLFFHNFERVVDKVCTM